MSVDGIDYTEPIVTIGSLASNDIPLKNGSVSRRHCVIVNYPGDVWLYDLESTVGTRVDGNRLHGRMHLKSMHQITIGNVPCQCICS